MLRIMLDSCGCHFCFHIMASAMIGFSLTFTSSFLTGYVFFSVFSRLNPVIFSELFVFLVMYFFPLPVVSRRRSNLYTSVYFSLTLLVLSLASNFFFSLIRYFFFPFRMLLLFSLFVLALLIVLSSPCRPLLVRS
jgi:hypothetical protein